MRDTFANRLMRAARLDATLYEEVEADEAAFGQAAVAILLSSVAAGVGALLPGSRLEVFFWIMTAALIGWILWAGVIFFVGTKMFPEAQTSSNMGELLRAIGFASAPGMLRILGVVGPLREIVFVVAAFWMLAAMVVAVRQALDYSSTGRAIVVCLVGWLVQIAIFFLVAWVSGAVYVV